MGQISGNVRLDVWSEVIPPFHLMPREVLQVGQQQSAGRGSAGRQKCRQAGTAQAGCPSVS